MFEGLYRAQSAWDEVMGANAAAIVERERKKMVVLVGSGHLIYNLGLNRRAYERTRLPFKTVIGVFVDRDKPAETVARSLGDYLFGITEEERPAYPSLGIGLKKVKDLENLFVDPKPIDGVARGQDIEKGDIILTADGRTWTDVNDLRTHLAAVPWDGEVKLHLLRAGVEKDVTLKIKLSPPPAEKK
jgi:S1-C subfamily serine protease